MLLNKFVFPYDFYKEEKILHNQVVVVSIFGKSSYLSGGCKADIIDKLLGYNIFKKCMLEDTEINDDFLCNIEGFYDKKENIIYLHYVGSFDTHSLLKIYELYSVELEEKGFLTVWTDLKYRYSRALLFLFFVSHVLVVTHPTHVFDLSYVQLFKAFDTIRQKLSEKVSSILKGVKNISSEWQTNGRFCCPRILFYFEKCPPSMKNIDNPEVLANLKKLEHSVEDQIYRILKKCRILSSNTRNSLCAVPLNQEFVFIETETNVMKDWTSFYLNSLISFCTNPNTEQNHCNYGFESLPEAVVNPTASDDHTFSVFLRDHTETAFTKGFDDSAGRHSSANLFEVPVAEVWFEAANKLFDFFVLQSTKDDVSDFSNLKNCLDVDQRFSEARCNKVFPLAIATYQENLPSHYTKKYHETKVTHALSVFGIHARGPQVDNYIQKLVKECDKYWKSGRQMCEILSLTGNPCNLPLHKSSTFESANSESIENINVADLPVTEHSSGVRYISSCNCGHKQGPRDDPFTVRAANYDFYQILGEDCGCSHYDKIQFPVFQPSTKDYRAAQLFSKPTKIVGRKDNVNTLMPNKEFGQETQHGPTQGLSLALISCHSMSLASDMMIVEEQGGFHPAEPINDHNPLKPSQASLTQTSEKIVIQVTDHSDSNKDKGLVRQPSTTEYLPGMLHSESPPGLLPQFPSWSLVCLGPSSLYSHNLGLQEQHHPGFLAGSAYLLPWDVTVRLEHHMKERFWASNDPRNKNAPQRNRRKGTKEFNVKIFVGVEYECPCGHRFMCSSPEKVLKATGSGLVRDNGSKVTNCDMPLYYPCPCRNSKQLIAQLMRIHVVTPKAPVNVTLNPRVQPAPSPCPVFVTGIQEPVRLSQSSYWILRLPYPFYIKIISTVRNHVKKITPLFVATSCP